jgi:valyl-tRNA synthetase
MSKSLGNGIDPLEIIDKYGADALRFSLVNGISAGGDVKYSAEKLEGYSNFMNKIWNASRFVLMNCDNVKIMPLEEVELTLADKWILTNLDNTVKKVTKFMDKYDVGVAAAELYDFVWSKFCDWYIEMTKPMLYSDDDNKRNSTLNVLLYVLRAILKLLHPFIPFITEEIYDELPNKDAEDIMISAYPESAKSKFYKATADMELVMDTIRGIRNMRQQMNVPQTKRTAICVIPNGKYGTLIKKSADYIVKLASGSELMFEKPEGKVASLVTEIAQIYIPMGELIDFAKEKERLLKEIETCKSEIARANGKLNNQGFVAKAPEALIEAEKAKVVKYTELMEKLNANLKEIE